MRLNGRDERGFSVGSYQARQAERLYAKAALELANSQDNQCGPETLSPKARQRLLAALERPKWWGTEPPGKPGMSARFGARKKAARAAEKLGCDVPEWAIAKIGPPFKRLV